MTTAVESALSSIAMSTPRFRLPARARRNEPPRKFEREYRKNLRSFVTIARRLLDELLMPRLKELEASAGQVQDHADAFDDDVSNILQVARGSFEELTGRERVNSPEEMAAKVTAQQKSATIKQFKGLLGVDIFVDDAGVANIVRPFITENVKLIKSVSDRYFDEVETLVLRNFSAGQRAEVVRDEIIKRTGVAQSRAKLIARDQIGKLWGNLNKHRQESLGVKQYKWRTSQDERVRTTHQLREGKIFSWNNPPPDGHPGQPIQCRCWAEPHLEDIWKGIEKETDKALGRKPKPEAKPSTAIVVALPELTHLSSKDRTKYRGNKAAPQGSFNADLMLATVHSGPRSKRAGGPKARTTFSPEKQREIRQQLNALTQAEGMVSHDVLNGTFKNDEFKVSKGVRNVGYHDALSGKIAASQDSMDKLTSMLTNIDDIEKHLDDIDGLVTLVHEATHSCSPIEHYVYNTIAGLPFEEATTELAARLISKRAVKKLTGKTINVLSGIKSISAGNQYIGPMTKAVSKSLNMPLDKATEAIAQASIDIRKLDSKFDNINEYTMQFAKLLPGVKTEQQAQQLALEIRKAFGAKR